MSWQSRLSDSKQLQIKFEKNKLSSMQLKQLSAKSLRLIEDGRIVLVRGELQSSRDEMLAKAKTLVQFGQQIDYDFLQKAEYESKPIPDIAYYNKLDKEALMELGDSICRMIKRVSPNLAADVQIVHSESNCELENSHGLTGAFCEYDFQLGIMVSGCTENDIIFWGKSFSCLPKNRQELDLFVDSFEAELIDMQTISEIKPGIYPFLLSPELVMNSCLDVLEAGFSHTYLENKTSPLSGRLHKKILSPKFTLADKAEFIPFDIDGIPCEPKVFFEKGVLKTFPIPLESAKKLDFPPNGSLIGGPCNYAASLSLSPGQKNSKELLSSMEEGVLLLMSGDMVQGNLIGGNLSGTIQSAFHVRNGKICGRLKSRSLSFNFYEAFADKLLALSSDAERFGGTLYTEGPWALIDGVSVC